MLVSLQKAYFPAFLKWIEHICGCSENSFIMSMVLLVTCQSNLTPISFVQFKIYSFSVKLMIKIFRLMVLWCPFAPRVTRSGWVTHDREAVKILQNYFIFFRCIIYLSLGLGLSFFASVFRLCTFKFLFWNFVWTLIS